MSALDGSKYVSLIDAGISNIWSLSLPSHLESLNLHGNFIRHISNLSHLTRLVHLDLSANQISVIDGLERLAALKTLNLSSNLIKSTDGLSGLRSLERLNLSYNQIEDISGLAVFSDSSCRLQWLALHGNKLHHVENLVLTLKNVLTLRSLVLSQDGSSNPLCHIHGYVDKLWSGLPGLHTVNDIDRQGQLSKDVDFVSSIPGLDAYLDFLVTSEEEQKQKDLSQAALITPKVDAVLERFRQRYIAGLDTSSSESGQKEENLYKIQKDNLPSPGLQRSTRNRGSLKDDKSSGDDGRNAGDGFHRHRRKIVNTQVRQATTTKMEGPRQGSVVDRSASCQRGETPQFVTRRRQGKHRQAGMLRKTQRPDDNSGDDDDEDNDGYKDDEKSRPTMPVTKSRRESCDGRGREEEEAVCKNLLVTLEAERERRLKAEQATRRLTEILKVEKAKGQETESMKNSALEATIQLKQAVMNEHESNQILNNQAIKLQEEIKQLKESLEEAKRGEERSREALKAAEATLTSREADAMAERMHQKKKLQESQQRASAMSREAELLKNSLDATKLKLQQVQETLAVREHSHREEMKNLYSLNSPELQEVIAERLKAAEKSFQSDLIKQREKIEQLSKQYSELEDEFRYALQVEETRFREIKNDLDRERAENVENKQLLLSAQRKDESSTSMITELTALVKEQKGRIAELARCKQEQTVSFKERIQNLEESLEHSRKQVSQMELLRQTQSKLQATVQAQESVIEGLKAERKLWGQELAQQGASLSQDRGRLEAKIEALNAEILSLKKQLERETDMVKIKTKMVDDQTETVRKLKEAVVERDETIKSTREECLATQRSLEEQLAEMKIALDETRDLLDRTSARKGELKQQVVGLQKELQESKNSHSALSAKWKERSEMIGRLEQQVTEMKNVWTEKEAQLAAERDAALKQAKQTIEQLKTADSAFRKQLELKEIAFQEKITQMEFEKQQEVELANKKVAIVEDEMRDLLSETEASKRAMETKLKKLTQALGDLTTDFGS